MADDLSTPADRAAYYRSVATVIRACVSRVKSVEARDELAALAEDYEILARYVDSRGPQPASAIPRANRHARCILLVTALIGSTR